MTGRTRTEGAARLGIDGGRKTLVVTGASLGAKVKVVEVPPGPPVLSPLVAEIYGPDEAGRHAVAKRVRAEFGRDADIVAHGSRLDLLGVGRYRGPLR